MKPTFQLMLLALMLVGCGTLFSQQPVSPAPMVEMSPAGQSQATAMLLPSSTPMPIPSATALTPLPNLLPRATISADLRSTVQEQEQLLIELYRQSSPAVVSIDVDIDLELPEDHPELPIPPGQQRSRGSGFLFDSQGHIVTNNHVVEDANAILVTFADGSSTVARRVGLDPGTDLAVIKVDQLPPGVLPLPVERAGAIEVGQMVVAIGNPFGLQNTLTQGIISGLGRTLNGPPGSGGNFSIPNIIQTDAAINPGNSGGPLLNMHGEVIGVNTAIRSESGSFAGIGYAVPSSAINRIVPVLIRDGAYQHPWIGIRMTSVDALMADAFALGTNYGVLVTYVHPDSPAAQAGLRAGSQEEPWNGGTLLPGGDIIIAMNDQPVRTSDDLISYLQLATMVGDTITVTIIRDGNEQAIPLTLLARP
ncbi:MAG: PDZ domain-containing protein [Chloroflexaceae bacterium]|nr:PDZ domain-containing protein [Chloroflexaceae bacterium]